MPDPIVIQSPATAGVLILLFHGVCSTPQRMRPLGEALQPAFPDAVILSVASPHRCDTGDGFQWFSVRKINAANRALRVAAAMPTFLGTIRALQMQTGISSARTIIVGFSQGAIMALEASQMDTPPAARIVAIAGRFASLPQRVPADTCVHLIHGDEDSIISVQHAFAASEALTRIGARVTTDIILGLDHRLEPSVADRLVARLRTPAANP